MSEVIIEGKMKRSSGGKITVSDSKISDRDECLNNSVQAKKHRQIADG